MRVLALSAVLVLAALAGCFGPEEDGPPAGTVNPDDIRPPTARFDLTPSSGGADTVFRVDAGASSDPAKLPLTFSWDWGDGTKSEGARAEHTYGVTDTTFKITLVAANSAGLSATASKLVTLGSGKNSPPVVHLDVDVPWVKPGEAMQFSAHASDPDGDGVASLKWEFGRYPDEMPADIESGDLQSGQKFSHTFVTPGRYIVHCHPHPWMKQTIIVDPAASIHGEVSAQILDGNTLEEFFFSPEEMRVTPGTRVTWDNVGAVMHTVTSEGFEPLYSALNIEGEGGSHAFQQAGWYAIRVTATDGKGAKGYGVLNVLVDDEAPDRIVEREWNGTVRAPSPPNDDVADTLQTKQRHTFVMEYASESTFTVAWDDAGRVNKLKFRVITGASDKGTLIAEVNPESGNEASVTLDLPKGGYNVVVEATQGAMVTYTLSLVSTLDITAPSMGHDDHGDGGGHQH